MYQILCSPQRFFKLKQIIHSPISIFILNNLQSLPKDSWKMISASTRSISLSRAVFKDKIIQETCLSVFDDSDKASNSEEVKRDDEAGFANAPSVKKLKPKLVIQKVEFSENDLKEKFIKGSGNGGQAINKTNSCVEITHIPTGIVIQCQKTRSQAQNRKIARKLLLEKLDDHINGKLSKSGLKAAKVLKQKKKQRRRALTKMHGPKSSKTPKKDQEESEDNPTEL
ncbi:hypothetical protein DSO57_1010378 [Entomophthora muscae]|uniref:Uncharacterized protein n=1 Tax=Entomophthora muscae TaxID=34485 RepID=A0ACC2US14_9FUNG|nr:hypothetical protein DSO57_1010378 [Entomophthora muscae]